MLFADWQVLLQAPVNHQVQTPTALPLLLITAVLWVKGKCNQEMWSGFQP